MITLTVALKRRRARRNTARRPGRGVRLLRLPLHAPRQPHPDLGEFVEHGEALGGAVRFPAQASLGRILQRIGGGGRLGNRTKRERRKSRVSNFQRRPLDHGSV